MPLKRFHHQFLERLPLGRQEFKTGVLARFAQRGELKSAASGKPEHPANSRSLFYGQGNLEGLETLAPAHERFFLALDDLAEMTHLQNEGILLFEGNSLMLYLRPTNSDLQRNTTGQAVAPSRTRASRRSGSRTHPCEGRQGSLPRSVPGNVEVIIRLEEPAQAIHSRNPSDSARVDDFFRLADQGIVSPMMAHEQWNTRLLRRLNKSRC